MKEEKENPINEEMEGRSSFKEDDKNFDDQLQQNNGDKDKDDDDEPLPPTGGTGSNGTMPVG